MVRGIAALALFMSVVAPARRPLEAHPLHSSYAEVTRERTGKIAISVRLFADDFRAILDSLGASSGQSQDEIARRYVQRHLIITVPGQSTIPTEWCGIRFEQTVVWVCVRSNQPVVGSLRLRNTLMFDRFTDQISIIRWAGKKDMRTVVLSARMPEARLD